MEPDVNPADQDLFEHCQAVMARRTEHRRRRGERAERAARVARLAQAVDLAAELRDGFDPHGFFVYMLFENDTEDVPFYVGQTINIFARVGQHCAKHGARISSIKVIRCATSDAMRELEGALIRKHRPQMNIVGSRGRHG